jgi:myosin-5
MSLASKALPALHPIKSLPPGFKVNGNLTRDLMESRGDAKLRNSGLVGTSSPENDALIGDVSEESQDRAGGKSLFNEDIAYSGKAVLFEDRASIADEDLESVPLPFQTISVSSRESRWSDTTPCVSKKVLLASDSINLILGFECIFPIFNWKFKAQILNFVCVYVT